MKVLGYEIRADRALGGGAVMAALAGLALRNVVLAVGAVALAALACLVRWRGSKPTTQQPDGDVPPAAIPLPPPHIPNTAPSAAAPVHFPPAPAPSAAPPPPRPAPNAAPPRKAHIAYSNGLVEKIRRSPTIRCTLLKGAPGELETIAETPQIATQVSENFSALTTQ